MQREIEELRSIREQENEDRRRQLKNIKRG